PSDRGEPDRALLRRGLPRPGHPDAPVPPRAPPGRGRDGAGHHRPSDRVLRKARPRLRRCRDDCRRRGRARGTGVDLARVVHARGDVGRVVTERITRALVVTEELVRAYSRRGNYHTDTTLSAGLNLPGLVAQGMQAAGPAYGALLDVWGETF